MPKKVRLTIEQKREKIQEIYNKRQEVFNLKEIESLATKAGVVTQTVKDVNSGLLDDNLIESDKIGASVFFWSFPAKHSQAVRVELGNLEEEEGKLDERMGRAKRSREEVLVGREEGEERTFKMQRLGELKREITTLGERVEELKENDPEEVERLEKSALDCREGANRWTDNLWEIKSWCVKKKGMDGKTVDKMLGISSTFDYIE